MGKAGLIKHTDVETLVSEEHRKDNSSVGEPKDDLHQSHELHPFGPNSQFAHEDYSRTPKDSVKD